MGSDIFLSYSRADQEIAEAFVKFATANGLSVWYDKLIQCGDDWRGDIVEELSGSRALVILFSDNSNASRQLIKELGVADKLNKVVIPILIANCEPRGPYLYELATRNWVNLWPNPETRLPTAIENLKTLFGLWEAAPAPTSIEAGGAPAVPAPAGVAPTPTAPVASFMHRPPTPEPSALLPPTLSTQEGGERWFPLGRYDLYFIVPWLIWIAASSAGLFGKGDNTAVANVFEIFLALVYMCIVAVRNARLNRSVFSAKSFTLYLALFGIAFLPILFDKSIAEPDSACGGFLFLSIMLAFCVNILQAVLRWSFQRKEFLKNTGALPSSTA